MFPNIGKNYKNHVWLGERVILAVKNKDVDDMNIKILKKSNRWPIAFV